MAIPVSTRSRPLFGEITRSSHAVRSKPAASSLPSQDSLASFSNLSHKISQASENIHGLGNTGPLGSLSNSALSSSLPLDNLGGQSVAQKLTPGQSGGLSLADHFLNVSSQSNQLPDVTPGLPSGLSTSGIGTGLGSHQTTQGGFNPQGTGLGVNPQTSGLGNNFGAVSITCPQCYRQFDSGPIFWYHFSMEHSNLLNPLNSLANINPLNQTPLNPPQPVTGINPLNASQPVTGLPDLNHNQNINQILNQQNNPDQNYLNQTLGFGLPHHINPAI